MTVCCVPNSSQLTCVPRILAQTSTRRKRSVDVGSNGSTCSTTTRRSLQSDVVRAVMYRVVIPRFQNGLYDLRIPANVVPHAPDFVGIVELSAVDRPY